MYRWDPQEYQTSSPNQKKWGIELLSKLHITGNEKVLDIGCGNGDITALIAERVPHGFIVGVDSSEDMIRLARRSFPSEKHQNLSFLVKDARKLDFCEEFDAVFSNACLHWIIGQLPVLEGIRSSLKPSGKVLLQMEGKGNAAEILDVLDAIMKKEVEPIFCRLPHPIRIL